MRRLEIQSPAGRDQHYRAFVADDELIAMVAGVSGRTGAAGEPITDMVGQAGRAAELISGLIEQSKVEGQPQIILRVLASASAEYGNFIDEIGDAIRDALGSRAPSVNVTLSQELMNECALLELDAVLAG